MLSLFSSPFVSSLYSAASPHNPGRPPTCNLTKLPSPCALQPSPARLGSTAEQQPCGLCCSHMLCKLNPGGVPSRACDHAACAGPGWLKACRCQLESKAHKYAIAAKSSISIDVHRVWIGSYHPLDHLHAVNAGTAHSGAAASCCMAHTAGSSVPEHDR